MMFVIPKSVPPSVPVYGTVHPILHSPSEVSRCTCEPRRAVRRDA